MRYLREKRTINGFGWLRFLVFLCAVLFWCVPAFAVDVDRDGKDDITVYRPAYGSWLYMRSSDNVSQAVQYGVSGDIPVPGDYDGDGKTDIAVYRPSTGGWFIVRSLNGTTQSAVYGVPGDLPVPEDYDGDGKTDIAVYRPSTGGWFIVRSSNGTTQSAVYGVSGDLPVPGDYDGDGKADVAIYRPSTGGWFIVRSLNGTTQSAVYGIAGDVPVPGDYDGDGMTDIAVYRPSTGAWFITYSSTGVPQNAYAYGVSEDIPVPGDYDGDGKTDIAIYRPAYGYWFIVRSSDNATQAVQFGEPSLNDIPQRGRTGRRANHVPTAAGAQRPVYADFAGAWTPWVDDADIWDTFTYQVSTQPLYGTASLVGGRLQYAPAFFLDNYTDSFAFEATDSGGAPITGTASVRVYYSADLTRCTSPCRVNSDGTIQYIGKAGPCAFYGITTTRTDPAGTPVTMDHFSLWPSNTNAIKGVVVLIGGGAFDLTITGDPATGFANTTGGGNFIVRTAQLFADAGYQAVAIDRPSDQPPPGSTNYLLDADQYRVSVNHAVDILQVLKHINAENRDVFLAGFSKGAVSAVSLNRIATGISLSSPVTSGISPYMYVGRPDIPRLLPSYVNRPVHVLWHEDDECSVSTPSGSQALYDSLATTTPSAFNVASGGVRVTVAGGGVTPDVCGAFDYHGFLGIEPTAVGYITNWLDDQVTQLAGNNRPEAVFATVATPAGVAKQVELATLTRDPDGDPLSYGLTHLTTSLGGSVAVNGSMVTYTPPPGVSLQTDYFVYVVADGNGGVAAGVITVEIGG